MLFPFALSTAAFNNIGLLLILVNMLISAKDSAVELWIRSSKWAGCSILENIINWSCVGVTNTTYSANVWYLVWQWKQRGTHSWVAGDPSAKLHLGGGRSSLQWKVATTHWYAMVAAKGESSLVHSVPPQSRSPFELRLAFGSLRLEFRRPCEIWHDRLGVQSRDSD